LHTTQIGPTLEEVSCKAMTQHMGCQPVKNTRLPAVSGQELPEGLARHAAAAGSDKKILAGTPFGQDRPSAFLIGLDSPDRVLAHGHQPLLAALSHGPQDTQVR